MARALLSFPNPPLLSFVMNTFLQAYIECALWSSTDNSDESGGEPLDKNYSISDIAPETMDQMEADCEQFQNDNYTHLETVLSLCDDSRAGHDFWLNRNGHGSGFWDEYHGKDKAIADAFKSLSEASKAWGTFDLYIGDDGRIYGQ